MHKPSTLTTLRQEPEEDSSKESKINGNLEPPLVLGYLSDVVNLMCFHQIFGEKL
jgi:hypothetical protein